jgi:autotransporter-associated beta strand protein
MPSGTPGPNESFAVLDMSELDTFTFSTAPSFTFSSFGVGTGLATTNDQGAVSGKVILGNISNIDANRISIGGQSNSGSQGSQPVSLLVLGQANNINTNLSGNLDVGGDPNALKDSSGGMIFRSGLTDAVLTLGSPATRTGFSVARHRGGTGHHSFGVMDMTSASGTAEGTFNAFAAGTQRVGTGATGGAGAGIGMLSLDKGAFDAGGNFLVGATGTTQNANPNTGYVNVGLKGSATDTGAGSIVTPGTITLGQRFHANSTNTHTGVLNLANSGAVTADRVFLGDNIVADAGTGATAGATVGEVNLNGGTLTTGQIKAGSATAQVGTLNTRLVHFNGGTLKVKPGTTFAGSFMEGLTRASVGAGGANVDTNGVDVTIAQGLEAPAAGGITAIEVATGGSGYRVAPVVLITPAAGDTGAGATAVAQINSAGAVTGITVTNPGGGYAAAPTIQLIANGGTSIANMSTPFGGVSATLNATIGTPASGGFTKNGAGTLTLSGVNTYTGPTVANEGKLVLGKSLATSASVSALNDATIELANDGSHNQVINTGEIALGSNARIDLRDNKLLTTTPVGTFDGSTYSGVQGQVARAYNFGAWDQPGLTTSEENAGQNAGALSNTTTIATATAAQVLFIEPTQTALFQGQIVTGATTIAMYTYAGDLNMDGLVDGADYGVIDNSVQFPGTEGYANGDFNYDGIIDGADYGIIDNTVQLQSAPFPGVTFGAAAAASSGGIAGVTAVPEPSACGFAIIGAAALLGRRRRRAPR